MVLFKIFPCSSCAISNKALHRGLKEADKTFTFLPCDPLWKNGANQVVLRNIRKDVKFSSGNCELLINKALIFHFPMERFSEINCHYLP